jgi:CRISPR-associated protein Cas2
MPMTIVVTRDVADRYRGFLASVMPEVAPGVYVSPELSAGVRDRMVAVLSDWWLGLPGGSIVCLWKDNAAVGGLAIRTFGIPQRQLADLDGALVLMRKS